MADVEWYKATLEHFTNFIMERVHPRYGPCDGLGEGGNCSECLRVLGLWKAAYDMQQAQGRVVAIAPPA
jgi:hypothetical protein